MLRASIDLRPREPPLPAVGVAAVGSARAGLAAAALRALARGIELRAAAGDGWLVILGETRALPWADGCRWLGRDGDLLLPTTTAVWPTADLVAAACRRDAPEGGDGLIVVLDDHVLVGPMPTRTADPTSLIGLR